MKHALPIVSVTRLLFQGVFPPSRATVAEAILSRHGRTFAFAVRWLPPERRHSVAILYAFCRILDDLVDEPMAGQDRATIQAELEAWRDWFGASPASRPGGIWSIAPREPLGSEVASIVTNHRLPVQYFLDLLDGLTADLGPREIVDFAELHHYCYQVAGTVGLMMAHLLGATTAPALAAAEALGIAMQLTNILRDVGGDLAQDRVYLPQLELAQAGLSRAQLVALYRNGDGPDSCLRHVLREQIARAEGWYQRGLAGIDLLPVDCRLPVLIAGRLYRRILTEIEQNDYDVLRRRAATSLTDKVAEAAAAISSYSLGLERSASAKSKAR